MTRSPMSVSHVSLAGLLSALISCSSASQPNGAGSGGSTGSGGTTASGGTVGRGGTTGSGGATASGGASGSGGATGSGGTPGSGGTTGLGGTTTDAGAGGSDGRTDVGAVADVADAPAADGPKTAMTFFITSVGSGAMGGNLGGLAGADAKCQSLAAAAGAGGRTWKAYLSTNASGGQPAVNARDRIGTGPWVNSMGTMIAANLEALHAPAMNMINAQNGRDEKGGTVPTNQHDIVTGSTAEGMASPDAENATCMNWTSNATGTTARVGHFNRMGGGMVPTSWNSAHATPNCTPASIEQVAGAARTYCFAIN